MLRTAPSLVLVAVAALATGLSGCKQPPEKPATPPPVAAAPAAPPPGATAATPSTDVTGACYESKDCTPTHNPAPGSAGITQAECVKTTPNGSWQSMTPPGVTWGQCQPNK